MKNDIDDEDTIGKEGDAKHGGDADGALRELSFHYTCQLTALYGLQQANDEKTYNMETIVIHVVGARQAEIIDVTRWELLLLELPHLKCLTVVFVGPELK